MQVNRQRGFREYLTDDHSSILRPGKYLLVHITLAKLLPCRRRGLKQDRRQDWRAGQGTKIFYFKTITQGVEIYKKKVQPTNERQLLTVTDMMGFFTDYTQGCN